MILPTKHIPVERSLLGIGAILLQRLDKPKTVVGLWNEVRQVAEVGTFLRFVLVLDLLYTLGAISLDAGLIVRQKP